MSYVDKDGDLILETKAEVQEFARDTPCLLCSEEALEILNQLGDKHMIKMVFSATCEHGRRS